MTDTIVALLNDWNTRNDSATYRNALRNLAEAAGYDPKLQLGEFVKAEILNQHSQQAPPSPTPIDPDARPQMREDFHAFLRYVLTTGYAGEGMRDPEEAMEYLHSNLDTKKLLEELPDEAKRFWSKFDTVFARWEYRRRRDAARTATQQGASQ